MDPDEAAESADFWNQLNPNLRRNALTIWEHEDAVRKVDPDHWLVLKHRGVHRVRVYRRGDLLRCAQDKHDYTQDRPCAHILVVMLYEGMTELPNTASRVYRKGDRPRNHGLEARAWKACPEEVPALLARLLHSALPTIDATDHDATGRPRTPLYPLLYQSVMRVWDRQNLRRIEGVMDEAKHRRNNGYGPVSAATLSRFLNDPQTTEVLEQLLSLSTWPVRPYESIAHQDGTGLTTQHFGAYYQEKHEKPEERREHEWMFTVILWTYEYTMIAGLRSQVKGFGEAQWAVPLLMRAQRMLKFKEFGGDRAYSAGYLFDYLKRHGIDGQMKFKDNATGNGLRGPRRAFKEALQRSKVDKEGYAARANRKNNVETGNAALKRILGDRLYSRGEVAQRNELLCMALAYNLTRLVYVSHAREVEIDFLGGVPRLDGWESLDALRERFWNEYPHARI